MVLIATADNGCTILFLVMMNFVSLDLTQSQSDGSRNSIRKCGTGLELVKRQATVRYPYHSANVATCGWSQLKPRVQGAGEYFPLLQLHAQFVEVEIGGVVIYRKEVEPILRALATFIPSLR
ncbi:hypothetical protein TNCV_3899191 [Trichonephila clavipes]|nr:hypothetical protein TNCV_3899191 [Trichonephila clavipes]